MTADQIIASTSNWVYSRAKLYAQRYMLDYEVLTQESFLRICKYAHTYDPAKSMLTTWVNIVIRSAARTMVIEAKTLKRLAKVSSLDDNEEFTADERVASEPQKPDALWSDELEAIRAAVARLPPRLGQVVELLFGLVDGIDRTAVEVANLLGVSRQRIVQMMSRAYSQLAVDPRLLIAFEDREPPRFLIEVLRVKETGLTCRRAISPVILDRRDLLSA